jgi:hypothetical protein
MDRDIFIKPEDTIIKRKDIVARVLYDQMILVYPESDHPFRLNGAGAMIWGYMDHYSRVDDLINIIYRSYNIDRDSAVSDTISFLTELLEKNIIIKV